MFGRNTGWIGALPPRLVGNFHPQASIRAQRGAIPPAKGRNLRTIAPPPRSESCREACDNGYKRICPAVDPPEKAQRRRPRKPDSGALSTRKIHRRTDGEEEGH